ncbi:MAG: efflux RND transporter periplasmic adaptor subunit [Desulfovibrio sp.]|nr:efflux RND transporter periplasmic adaptor subunit [Desulfovibrio sp.]
MRDHGFHGKWIVFWVLLCLCTLFLLWKLFFAENTRPQPRQTLAPVRTARAFVQDVPSFLQGLGTVVPSSDVLVKSRVSGQLMKIHFREGQHVEAGTLLAEIDPRPFQAQLAEVKGRLEADKAQLANALRDLSRYSSLVKGDFVERQKYDAQKALVAQYQGTVAADQASYENARLQLEYSRITAPASGITGLRKVDVGNQITSNDSEGIVRIAELSPCDVLFTVPETVVPKIVTAFQGGNNSLLVQAWDREQKNCLAKGILFSLDNEIDRNTGTVRLKARFDNADKMLYANQFVNARLCVEILKNAVTIPSAACQVGSQGNYVYVVTRKEDGKGPAKEKDLPKKESLPSGTVSMRLVTPGLATPRFVVITEGLREGEEVVVDGLDRLRDGSQVKIAGQMESPKAEPL